MGDIAQASLAGLLQVLAWPALGFLLVGTLVGVAVGLLPGLGGPTTLALMLPLVFRMGPVEAFALLLGMFAVTNTTGDITSILFGVPGEPTAAATIVDGHALARQGEAGRALGAALASSLAGAIVGAATLGLAVPVVRPLVRRLGSPEFFVLAVLGLTFVAALSGASRVRGLIAAGLGLWLATVGLDPVSGIERYTLGQLVLWDGIGLVPVTIGLYAIPELLDLALQGPTPAPPGAGRLGDAARGVRDTLRHWRLVLRCSVLGSLVAIVPGMGAATTQWLAYAHAVQSSPRRERFGRGAVEGVLGPAAANNSTLGGSLLTTVAFGVPASVGTAVLMGAFLIQGVVPGPSMLAPGPGGHLALTLAMAWAIVVSNVVAVALCFVGLGQLVRITAVRASLLFPCVLVLIDVGAFAEKNAVEDLTIVLVFGALGWAMARHDWPRPALLLGLVLGPLAEAKLFLSTDHYGAAWLARPGVLALAALGAACLTRPLWRPGRQGARPAGSGSTPAAGGLLARGPRPRRPRVDGASAFTGLLVLVAAWALWESRAFGARAGLFPWAIGLPTLGLALIQLGRDLTGRGGTRPATEAPPVRRVLGASAWIVGFWIAIRLLGFALATPLMVLLCLRLGAGERWPVSLALSLGCLGLVHGVFALGLGVPFPPGRLLVWLGVAG